MSYAELPRSRSGARRAPGIPATPLESGNGGFSSADVVDRFQRYLRAQERSPCTVKQYGHIARTFLGYVGKPLDEVTPQDLETFREYLVVERHYSKNSVYTTVRGLACLFRSFGLTAAEGLQAPHRPERLPRYLTEEETHRLFDAVKGNARDSAMIHVLAYCGLRVSELCNLLIEEVDFNRNLVHVRSGKGDKDREVVMEDKTRAAIDRYLTERTLSGDTNPRMFPVGPVTVERVVRRAAANAGIQRRVTPHILRHTLATALLSRGLDLRYIQKLLGHASVATTQIYTHVENHQLRDAYQRAKPEY